jgi:hypothetical protein
MAKITPSEIVRRRQNRCLLNQTGRFASDGGAAPSSRGSARLHCIASRLLQPGEAHYEHFLHAGINACTRLIPSGPERSQFFSRGVTRDM